MSRYAWVTVGWLVIAPMAAFADRAADVAALEAKCEQQREAKIAPLRAAEIAKCKSEGHEPNDCESFWRDYGNPVRTANGAMTPRLFSDLPACIASFKARREFELNGH